MTWIPHDHDGKRHSGVVEVCSFDASWNEVNGGFNNKETHITED